MVLGSINNPLGVAFNALFNNKKKEIHERSFTHKGSLFYAAIKGLVIFLVRGVSVSHCTPKY